MNSLKSRLILFLLPLMCGGAVMAETRHYVFFNMDRERISDRSFLETDSIQGAQLKYTWKELEPQKDRYDFLSIEKDLDFLTSKGKRLFIQLQDSSFDADRVNVPLYLLNDAQYNGGDAIERSDDGAITGRVARRWDPAVRERFSKLLAALGKQFDGKIEGINLPETAVEFGESGKYFPEGFTPSAYKDGVIADMKALKRAFPKSICIQYANFMPGEFLPWTDKSYLRQVTRRAREMKVGVGGPDLLPYKKGQMNNCYKFLKESHGKVPTAIAVQDGNCAYTNPRTKKRVTISELIDFAGNYLKADYIFWGIEEPYYSNEIIPFLKTLDHKATTRLSRP